MVEGVVEMIKIRAHWTLELRVNFERKAIQGIKQEKPGHPGTHGPSDNGTTTGGLVKRGVSKGQLPHKGKNANGFCKELRGVTKLSRLTKGNSVGGIRERRNDPSGSYNAVTGQFGPARTPGPEHQRPSQHPTQKKIEHHRNASPTVKPYR